MLGHRPIHEHLLGTGCDQLIAHTINQFDKKIFILYSYSSAFVCTSLEKKSIMMIIDWEIHWFIGSIWIWKFFFDWMMECLNFYEYLFELFMHWSVISNQLGYPTRNLELICYFNSFNFNYKFNNSIFCNFVFTSRFLRVKISGFKGRNVSKFPTKKFIF